MRLRVLCFLYYFPPSGGPGVRRGLEFVKHLGAHGIEPTVVTVNERTYDRPEEYTPDPAGLAEVPRGVSVRRVRSGEPVRLKRFLVRAKMMRLAQAVLYPFFHERQARWPRAAIREGARVLSGGGADLVYTCCGPYASNRIGLVLSRRFGVPWVTDHRDPWTQSWGLSWPSRAHHRACEQAEDLVLARCRRFVANTKTQREDLLRRFPSARPERIRVIPNGYDEAEFAGPAPAPDPEKVVILHAGSFSDRSVGGRLAPRRGLRRVVRERVEHRNRDFDLTTHSPLDTLRALRLLRERGSEFYPRLELQLVGSVNPLWREVARDEGVEDRLVLPGPVPHREVIGRMRAADLLLLTTLSRRSGGRVSCVSQKTYEYLRAGRPILAISGPSDARDLVLEAEAGTVAAPGDVLAIAEAIEAVATAKRSGEPLPGARRPEVVRRHDRRAQAGELADLFREAAQGARRR